MVAVVLWALVSVGIFLWNHFYETPYIGLRFSDKAVGFAVNGGWLCAAVAMYCLIRFFVRRRRDRRQG
jgi:hypothetical protein